MTPPKGRGRAEPDIVGQNQEHVGRALRRHNARRPGRFRLVGVEINFTLKRLRRRRQIAAIDSRCSVRRTGNTRGLLCEQRVRHQRGANGTETLVIH
jgi:hypothetical protein